MRGGYGIFYDWYDSILYEQTIRVDGKHQVDVIVQNPVFPVDRRQRHAAAGERDSFGVARSADHPAGLGRLRAAARGVGGHAHRLHVDARLRTRCASINVNAPVNGVRPGSDGRQHHRDPVDRQARVGSLHGVAERALHAAPHPRHGDVSVHQLAELRGFSATSLPSDSLNPDADWGPSAQDVRHRIFFNFNTPLGNGVRLGLNMQGSSALPYNITTGLDTNGDTVFNDRAAGVEPQQRAAARRSGRTNIRLNKSIGLGGTRAAARRTCRMPRRRRHRAAAR